MKNKYKYLITYCYDDKIGSGHFDLDKPINSFVGIQDIIKYLENAHNTQNLIIMNYTLVNKSKRRKRKFIR